MSKYRGILCYKKEGQIEKVIGTYYLENTTRAHASAIFWREQALQQLAICIPEPGDFVYIRVEKVKVPKSFRECAEDIEHDFRSEGYAGLLDSWNIKIAKAFWDAAFEQARIRREQE